MTLMFRCNALIIILFALVSSCSSFEENQLQAVSLSSYRFNGVTYSTNKVPVQVSVDSVVMEFELSGKMNSSSSRKCLFQVSGTDSSNFDAYVGEDSETVLVVKNKKSLPYFSKISVTVKKGELFGVKLVDDINAAFITEYEPSDKFPRISQAELFEKVQRSTFSYFWDYAHPISGMARERWNSNDIVTCGGSGFALMCIPVAIERGWITREEGRERVLKVLNFLSTADRFHGVWPHWLNGSSGKALPFSTYDNGADLVETSFMAEGLLVLRNYFSLDNSSETEIRKCATRLWEDIEWDWFRKDGKEILYWHWSPDYGWKMNMPVSGWNEAFITYVLAAASPTHSINKAVYDKGWWNNGANKPNYRDPLFFTHYSFMGLDPRKLKDQYADYWDLNCSFAKTNYKYCVSDPMKYGYSGKCWGLTASDYPAGYTASSPSHDTGTVAPTAALSSFPYTPDESEDAMEYFYYTLGDRLWGDSGFMDAFNFKDLWFAQSYIAIDQAPIVVMMENFRSGLIWDCFMKDKDLQNGLSKLGITWQ